MSEPLPYTNRLIHEKSPYLQQHAHNPVDWFPWGEEAFSRATEHDKPIFLSIGYSTCHWCHVMEKESFENVEVAQFLNDSFVCIKVDREEMPEIDNLYMEFAQSMMSGAAGWPLNVLLTPDLQPFFAATYLPPYPRGGMIGLVDLTHRIRDIWLGEEREQLVQQASSIVDVFQQSIHTEGDEFPSHEILEDAAEIFFKMADPVYGGIKGAPKFPIGFQQNLMMQYSLMKRDGRALFLVDRTLDMMQRGGIYDHLGGGFSRYSVDEHWLVPHFEKMLYDNALLIKSYQEAAQILDKPLYRTIAEQIISYLLRDMSHPEGGFYSAEDADTEGHEGYFYTWSFDEIMDRLGTFNHVQLFCEYFGITLEGNFEGRNILHTPLRSEEFAKRKGIDSDEFAAIIEEYTQILFRLRQKRVRPFKDDKILSGWNGLVIASLASCGMAFNQPLYIDAAEKAGLFVKRHLWIEGQLLRRWRDGQASYMGGLDDYACLIQGALYLFEADKGSHWLEWALEMARIVETEFKAPKGAYYMTTSLESHVILRKCQYSDGAEPSGNAIHVENLLRLYHFSGDNAYIESAEDVFRAVNHLLEQYPPGYCYHLMNLIRYYDRKAPLIVVALNQQEEYLQQIKDLLSRKHIPHKAIVWRREGDETLMRCLPHVKEKAAVDQKTTLYICYQGVCTKPVNSWQEIEESLSS